MRYASRRRWYWPPEKGGRRDADILGSVPSLTVAVADDSLLIREGISKLLSSAEGIEIVAICEDYDTLLASLDGDPPDVVLTDIRMPPTNTDEGIRIAEQLRESHPSVGVVVLSQFAEPRDVLALLEGGSDRRAYLLKERVHDRGLLTSAIRSVAEGGSWIDPKVVEVLIAARSRAEASPLRELTTREREVLGEIAQGASNAAIAESLFLTKRAVEKHINSIFMKLGLANSDDVSKRVKAALLLLAESGAQDTMSSGRGF
jgi:DNA-binding NarL/FixJ family response regulator